MRATTFSSGLLDVRVLLLFIFISGMFGLRFSCRNTADDQAVVECEDTSECGPDALCVNGECIWANDPDVSSPE